MSQGIIAPLRDQCIFSATGSLLAWFTERRKDLVPIEADGTICYHPRGRSPTLGPRIAITPSGHRIFYGEEGLRLLCTDPSGTVLHECRWGQGEDGTIRLIRARVRLDSLLWIGVIPEATTHTTILDLSRYRNPRTMTPDDLRRMAAQAWNVPFDDIQYFFPDTSFTWDVSGRVRVQLKKDGLFLLEEGTFTLPTFISYMGAIPWARIDLLNVVELFQSTLPGTGSAVLELIWGLCDDQRQIHGVIPLRYRGLPAYPSEPAYGLFSAFFRPEAPRGTDPHELFMDSRRANQVMWWLRHDPPWRYIDRPRELAVTVQLGMIQKVTVMDDPVGVPYVSPGTHGGFASCERTALVKDKWLELRDGGRVLECELDPCWSVIHETPPSPVSVYPFGWRAFFSGCPPPLDPVRVSSLALLYPNGEASDETTEVPELSIQPFALEQVYASLNRLEDLPSRLARITRVLIDGFDAVAAGCIDSDYTRGHTVLYRSAEWAQKQAQVLWDEAARAGRLHAMQDTRFVPSETNREDVYRKDYDLIYCWVPFAAYGNMGLCEQMVSAAGRVLTSDGLAFLVGPRSLGTALRAPALRLLEVCGVEDLARLPLLTEHLRLHPRTHLNPALTVFLIERK